MRALSGTLARGSLCSLYGRLLLAFDVGGDRFFGGRSSVDKGEPLRLRFSPEVRGGVDIVRVGPDVSGKQDQS